MLVEPKDINSAKYSVLTREELLHELSLQDQIITSLRSKPAASQNPRETVSSPIVAGQKQNMSTPFLQSAQSKNDETQFHANSRDMELRLANMIELLESTLPEEANQSTSTVPPASNGLLVLQKFKLVEALIFRLLRIFAENSAEISNLKQSKELLEEEHCRQIEDFREELKKQVKSRYKLTKILESAEAERNRLVTSLEEHFPPSQIENLLRKSGPQLVREISRLSLANQTLQEERQQMRRTLMKMQSQEVQKYASLLQKVKQSTDRS